MFVDMEHPVGHSFLMNDKKYKVIHLKRISKNKCIKAYQHRLIIEKHLKRKLSKSEIVHHKNGNTMDNRLCNLEVMSRGDHMKEHHTGNKSPCFRHDLKLEDIKKLLKKGMSLRAIGRALGAPHMTIRRRLMRAE